MTERASRKSGTSAVVLRYATFYIDGVEHRINPHMVPRALAADLEARIFRDHGQTPSHRDYRAGVLLDPGGMVMTKTPVVRVLLPGYSAQCKLDHVPEVVAVLRERLADPRGRHQYGRKTCLTVYRLSFPVVLPEDDVVTLLRRLRLRVREAEEMLADVRGELEASPHLLLTPRIPEG